MSKPLEEVMTGIEEEIAGTAAITAKMADIGREGVRIEITISVNGTKTRGEKRGETA